MKPSLRATFDRSFLFSCGSILLLAVAVPALAAPVVFDFDTGTPVLTVGKNAPFSQTAGGVTASFSSVSGSFSIQNDASAGLSLSQFSGKYVYPNVLGSVLEVKFDKLLSNLDLVFATADFPPIEIPTPVTLTAYMNSAASTPVGSVTVRATYGTDTLPMGTLSFSPGAPFNLVRMTIQSGGGMGFLVDNLAVQVSPATAYAIATSASPSSGGTTSGDGIYLGGSSVTVIASAKAGYAFVNWTENGTPVSTSASYTFNATADRTLVANFARMYTVATSASPSAGGSTSGDGSYAGGSNVTVTATAKPGYAFVNWTEGGTPVSTSASYSFSITANRTLVANFTQTFTITTSPSPSAGGSTSGDGTYNSGATVTVTATAKPGYAFVNWTENGSPVSASASYTFPAAANRTLVANFTQTFTITTSASPSAGGTTSGDGTYNSGASVTVAATAKSGYAFVNWTENGSPVSTLASYTFPAAADRTLVANFTQTFTITTSPSPSAGGSTSGDGTYNSGASVTVAATAKPGYAFMNWTENGSPVSTSASYTFPAAADRTLVANFTRIYTITTSASPGNGGTTSGDGVYADGTNVTVSAQANAGYLFVNWTESGSPVSTSVGYSFSAAADRTLVANFVADTDGDGVPDSVDQCPNTVHGSPVDAKGCPPAIPGDFDHNGAVDAGDLAQLMSCVSGPTIPFMAGCDGKDLDRDGDVDQTDFGIFQRCFSGTGKPANPNCAK